MGQLAGTEQGIGHFNTVALLGSSAEATVVYAGVTPSDEQAKRKEVLASRVSEYLGLMGLETEIRQP